MKEIRRLRKLLHRPYLRAAVVGLSLVAAVGATGLLAVQLRFDVPATAVLRYFSRLHSDTSDLTPLLRQPSTLAALERLGYATSGMNAGGLVYCNDGELRFYPWMPAEAAQDAARRSLENQEIYSQLLSKYLGAELDGLITELSRPQVRRSLGRAGVSPRAVQALRQEAAADPNPVERRLLLRRAARLIRPFMPSGAAPHQLELADKLRFYAVEAPRGRYLGLYEVLGPGWLAPSEPPPQPDVGRLLAITKQVDGTILVDDLRPGERRRYRLTPVAHPAGLPLYRVGSRA